MAKQLLKRLKPYARQKIKPETFEEYVDVLPGGIENQVLPFGREVELQPLKEVVQEAMRRFKPGDPGSDGWLAPRVHATLRLTRREAADPAIWDYLSAVVLREYVKWRWGDADGQIATNRLDRIRITSRNREIRHAISRLWWVAELSRNGPNYNPTVEAFTRQETVEWFVIRPLRNRAAAQAFLHVVSTLNGGKWATGIQVRALARGLDHILMTVVLDSIAPVDGPELTAVEEWIKEKPDPTLMYSSLPTGPSDPVDEEKIEEAVALLRHVWSEVKPLRESEESEDAEQEKEEAVAAAG